MTTVELLAYCRARKRVPDLVWQRRTHLSKNIGSLFETDPTPNGFHDMRDIILEPRSSLLHHSRTYATVLFTEA